MSNPEHLRIACPPDATFAIQVELDRHHSDVIVGTPMTSSSGDHDVIELVTTDVPAIMLTPVLVTTEGVTVITYTP
jgi:hypothetical protein